ncbi:hypothetical protein cyc_05299 [Cyclospora cayetanensis]|uniref:Uncharacterized protein n=1 Tax=Cyclospora cayetanensis TaxID=88456 RepID=A0A1D3CUB4_9EIME|nr:hypothetical protein cyc_05299 [Cyclospora cayetanensis]
MEQRIENLPEMPDASEQHQEILHDQPLEHERQESQQEAQQQQQEAQQQEEEAQEGVQQEESQEQSIPLLPAVEQQPPRQQECWCAQILSELLQSKEASTSPDWLLAAVRSLPPCAAHSPSGEVVEGAVAAVSAATAAVASRRPPGCPAQMDLPPTAALPQQLPHNLLQQQPEMSSSAAQDLLGLLHGLLLAMRQQRLPATPALAVEPADYTAAEQLKEAAESVLSLPPQPSQQLQERLQSCPSLSELKERIAALRAALETSQLQQPESQPSQQREAKTQVLQDRYSTTALLQRLQFLMAKEALLPDQQHPLQENLQRDSVYDTAHTAEVTPSYPSASQPFLRQGPLDERPPAGILSPLAGGHIPGPPPPLRDYFGETFRTPQWQPQSHQDATHSDACSFRQQKRAERVPSFCSGDTPVGHSSSDNLHPVLPGDPACLLLRSVPEGEEVASASRKRGETTETEDWKERLVLRYPAADKLTVAVSDGVQEVARLRLRIYEESS